jgi:hypothetical protein
MALLCHVPYFAFQISQIVVFDPEPILALPEAADHPGYPRAVVDAAQVAFVAGDYQRSLQLVGEAEAAVRRLGPSPGYHDVEALCFIVRAGLAAATPGGVGQEGFWLEAAERERLAGQLGLAAASMAVAANELAWLEPDLALATEALALARRPGWPMAIKQGLTALALTLAPSDPEQARRLFHEEATIDYDTPTTLSTTCFAAGRFGEWSVLLRTAQRLLYLERRTGGVPRLWLGGVLNLVARSLAEAEPEVAAVLQGGASGLITPLLARSSDSVESERRSDGFGEVMKRLRYETTTIVAEEIAQQRMRELRAQGAAMNRDQASAYARIHIDQYLAAEPGPAVMSPTPG